MIAFVLIAGLWLAELFINRNRVMTLKRALLWSATYICAACFFAGWLWQSRGAGVAQTFLAAYVMEKVLSVDNLMVFSAVFCYFAIPDHKRHKVLHYGILGAVVSRAVFTFVGVELLNLATPYTEFAFGLIVGYSALKVLKGGEQVLVDPNERWYIKYTRNWITVSPFWLCVIAIEATDIMFSFDSVPAVIAIAKQPYIIYTAMLFAILGLRALYFVLEHLTQALHYMGNAVGAVLVWIGAKLMCHAVTGWEVGPGVNLAIVGGILGVGVIASLWKRNTEALT